MDNITKGTITELKCITYFLELGYNVSVPQKPARYDFILDTGSELFKVQVKACHHRHDEDSITFATASRRQCRSGVVSHDYLFDGIDFFCFKATKIRFLHLLLIRKPLKITFSLCFIFSTRNK